MLKAPPDMSDSVKKREADMLASRYDLLPIYCEIMLRLAVVMAFARA